jgi:uncharacterized protein (DUF58 family)
MTDNKRNAGPSTTFKWAAAISAVLLIGMVFGASLWVLAAMAAAAVIVVNRFLASAWSTGMVAKRAGGDVEVATGESVFVQVSLTNTKRVPVLWLLAEDLVPKWATIHNPPALQITGRRLGVFLMWPGESRQLSYSIQCNRRGYYQIGPTVLETGDLMGLFRRYRVGTKPQYITVLPPTVELDHYDIASRRPVGEIRMRDNVMEDPTRLRGIRQWQPGDPMRRVHWSATARTGVLHSKVYEPTSIAGATLAVDMHSDTNPTQNEPVRTDLAVIAAVSIAQSMHDQSQPVGLVSNGRDAADRIRTEGWIGDHRVRDEACASAAMLERNDRLQPIVMEATRGSAHMQRLKTALARLERTDGMTFPELLIETESQISSETTLLAVFQTATPETLATLIGFARRGRAVAAIINTYDVTEFSNLAGPLIAANVPTFHLMDPQAVRSVCREVNLRAHV